jgi:hypothetical protein
VRKVFAVMSAILVLSVVVQFFLAAFGAFDTTPHDQAFAPHRSLGMAILGYAVVVVIVGALGRMPGRLIGMAALVAGLVVVQSLIRSLADALGGSDGGVSTAGKIVFGLHAVNGLFIMATAGALARRSRTLARSPN